MAQKVSQSDNGKESKHSFKKSNLNHNPRKRLFAALLLAVFSFCAIFVKLVFVTVLDSGELQVKAASQWLRDIPTEAPRGRILDRNGEVLAATATRYNLYVRPNSVKDKSALAKLLSDVFGFDEEKIMTKISKSASEITVATGATKEQLSAVLDAGLDGIYYSEDNFRYYPYGDFMTQALGFTGFDGNGQTGIEAYYDKYLSGTNGAVYTETDLVGRELADGKTYYTPGTPGLDVVTTLDCKIQLIAEGAVKTAVAKYNPKGVACLVMDYTDGSVLALAEYPSFDLNSVPRDDLTKLFGCSKSSLVSSVYEPGSTFKILTAAAALDCGAMTTSRRFYCAGSRVVDGKKIRCWKARGHGSIDFGEGVEQSCNCVFMDSALALGAERFYSYLTAFGLKSKTGIDVTGETSGLFIDLPAVKTVDLARIGFGQAVAVTPVGMLTAASAVVNDGKKVTPHLLKSVKDGVYGKTAEGVFEIKADGIISTATSSTMRELLTRVVEKGSGKGAAVNGYKIAGKTGTAQKYAGGRIAQGKYISSFLGFSLEEEAPYGVLLLVDEPQGYVYYGSLVAAPLVGDVFEGIFNRLGVSPAAGAPDIESTFDPDDVEAYAEETE